MAARVNRIVLSIAALLSLVSVLLPGSVGATQQGELTVTPSSGPVGSTVTLDGTGCNNPSQPVRLSFGQQVEEAGGGTVGSVTLPEIPVDADGAFNQTFTIPATLGPYQGQGGGSVEPGGYRFFSHPPLCIADFTVTASGLPPTGSAPAGGQSGGAPLLALVSIAGGVAALLGGGLLLRLRRRFR